MRTLAFCVSVLVWVLAGCAAPATPLSQPPTPSSGQATYDGRTVHYIDAGSGNRDAENWGIVLVHGWASDGRVWDRQVDALAQRARVLVIDLPGHGKSQSPAAGYSMDGFARATAAVMDDAGIERAVLVGHSNGTPVVRQFYRLFPERTLGLVAVDGTLKKMFDDKMVRGFEKVLQADNWKTTVSGFIAGMPGEGLDGEARGEITAMALSQPHEAVLGGFLAASEESIWEPDRIDVPLLLVLAAQPSWNDAYHEFVRGLQPRVEVVTWTGVSHFLMLERPEPFNRVLLEFVARSGPSR